MESRPDHGFNPFSSEAGSYGAYDLPNDFMKGLDLSDPSSLGKLFGIQPPPHKSPKEVQLEARRRRDHIFALHDRLRAILERHEATIQSRWSKKKKKQRLEVLATAWGPGMAPTHRPDFEAFRRETAEQRKAGGTKFRDHFMWPYINQEDLVKPKTLPLLLNSRGRHHPSEFAGTDCDAVHLGLVSQAVMPVFLNGHTMIMFVKATDRAKYGKLLQWDDHPDAFNWFHTRTQAQPGEGLLVLETQERLLEFLVACCQAVLHDIPSDSLTTSAFPLLPEPQLKSEKDIDGFESLAVMAAEAPYRVPAQLDLERIANLLRARASAAEDHLWALREDPGYFAEHLGELKEHRQEMIKDTKADVHPTLRPGRESIFWVRIIGNVVVNAYLELEIFAELQAQAEALRPMYAKYGTALSPADDLPEEFFAALLRFRHYLTKAAKGMLEVLKGSVMASPPWRRFFVREPPASFGSTAMRLMSKPCVKMTKVQGELLWLLRTLWEDGNDLFLISMPLALDELERLLETQPEANELLTEYLAKTVGSLSIVSQCLAQLERFQPWSRSFESALVERDEAIKKEYARRTGPCARLMAGLRENNLSRAAKVGDPSDRKFAYPSEKRRTRENTDILRRAEQNLDTFWSNIDQLIYNSCGDLDGTAAGKFLSQERSLQRTQEWVDEPSTTAKAQGPSGSSVGGHAPIYKPLSTLYFGLPGKSGVTETDSLPKQKVKTRGPASSARKGDTQPEPVEEAAVADRPTIFVGARDLKVFKTLFFDPTMSSHPGETPWNDFLHAMTSTGLFTAEKLYGSVWQFQRVNSFDQSRIQFHEPHPHGKIPFVMARRFGRRLNKHYGWARDTFVLKNK